MNLLNDTAARITIQAGIGTLDEARSGSSFFVDTTNVVPRGGRVLQRQAFSLPIILPFLGVKGRC